MGAARLEQMYGGARAEGFVGASCVGVLEAGYRAMQFNAVVETNAPAVRLWRSLGFDVIGTVPEAFDHPEHGLVGLHVMHRRLGAGLPRRGPPASGRARARLGRQVQALHRLAVMQRKA